MFKTSDALDFVEPYEYHGSSENESKDLEKCIQFTQTYIRYNEYITVEFDDVAKTATVLKKV